MSYVRIWWSESTYNDYTSVWDVDIEPECITGARFHSQEPRHATFKMEVTNIYTLLLPTQAGQDGIHACIVEIIEDYTYADANNEIATYTKTLFRGYVFRNGVQMETVKVSADGYWNNAIIATITVSDYMAVFMHYLTAQPQGASTTDGKTIFATGDERIIYDEIQNLWDSVPIGGAHPLWTRPSLTYDINTYPGLGFPYADFEVYRHPLLSNSDNPYQRYYAWLSLPTYPHELWSVKLRYVAVDLRSWSDWCEVRYGYAYVYGASYMHSDFNNLLSLQNVSSLINAGGWEEWYDIELPHIASHLPSEFSYFYNTPIDMSMGIAGTDVVYTLERYITSAWTPDFPLVSPLRLLVSGTLNTAAIRTIEDGELANEDYMAYMLNIYLAWLRQDGNCYYLSNKINYANAALSGFADDVNLTYYHEEMDDRIDTFNTVYPFIENSQVHAQLINEYAINTYKNYPRLCSWACNADVPVGSFVRLHEYNSNIIHITEKDYDPAEPQLWKYRGRSA